MPIPPPKAAFQFTNALLPPQGNYNDQSQVTAIQAGLKNIGLTCDQNNQQNILAILDHVAGSGVKSNAVSSFRFTGKPKAGTQLPGNAPAAVTDQTDDTDWEEVGPNDAQYGWYSKLDVIIQNADWVIAQNLYPITQGSESNEIKSSTFDSLKEAFENLGSFLSEIDDSDSIDPKQIAGTLGTIISNAMSSSSQDYSDSNTFVSLLVTGEQSNGLANGVGVIKWSYSLTIKDYKDKKKTMHDSSYSMTKNTAIFTDVDVLNNVYNQVIAHLNAN